MKKIIAMLLTSMLGVGVSISLLNENETKNTYAEEEKTQTREVTSLSENYIPFNTSNFTASDGTDLSTWIKPRNEVYWSEQKRSFNALDKFYNGFDNESWTGTITSRSFTVDNQYITFTLGGDASKNTNYVALCEGDTEISKVYNNYFNDPKLALNMALRVIEVPENYRGSEHNLTIKIVDNATGNFGGVTFGCLRINQTAEDVAKAISVHQNSLERVDFGSGTKNSDARAYTVGVYASNDEYATFRNITLTDANESFEEDTAILNWAYDREYSVASDSERFEIDFDNAISSESTYDWVEKMPFNKTGNKFFQGNKATAVETNKYRLISHSFTLSSNYISLKMAGRSATLQILDGDSLDTKAEFKNENIAFKDGGVTNVVSNDSRLNTMARVYIDVSSFKGQKVAIAIADSDNNGSWGLALFDEIITNYDTLPTLKLDKIEQVYDSNHFYGVVRNFYSGSAETTLAKAIAYLNSHYDALRKNTNGSVCNLLDSTEVSALLTTYNSLDTEVKAVVDTAEDYSYGINPGDDYYNHDVSICTVGETVNYLLTHSNTSSSSNLIKINNNVQTNYALIIIVLSSLAVMAVACIFFKKRKKNRVK